MKIAPAGAKLFHADRRTDGRTDRHDEANSHFSQLCKSVYITTVLTSTPKKIH